MNRRTLLAGFINFLEDHNLIEFDVIGDGDRRFSNRFRIQKYVFLAQKMGLDMPYKHSIYLCGPYSKILTDDYYHLARNRSEYEHADEIRRVLFNADMFLSVTRDRDNKWLEIATTLIERKPHCADNKDLVSRVKNFKDEPEPGYIAGVLDELETLRLV